MEAKKNNLPRSVYKFKMGRRHPVALGPRLSLKKYIKRLDLASVPSQADYSKLAMPVLTDIFGNDNLGNSVIAAGYHVVGLATGNGGDLFHATTDQIIADYSAIGGFDPNKPSNTDNGCDEVTALNYWCEHGFADGTKGLGLLAVDATNQQETTAAMYLFENLFFAMDLPDQWIAPMPDAPGFVWDVAGDPVVKNGHAVAGVGYNANGVIIDSWGFLGTLTWKAIAKYCTQANGGGLYVLLTPDQLAKGRTKAPIGVDWNKLTRHFNIMGANPPIPMSATANKLPVITSPKNVDATVDKTFNYKITATNNPKRFGASMLPAGWRVNAFNGLISGTPKVAGSFEITISAKNAKGTGTSRVRLTVNPGVTSPPSSEGTGKTEFRWVPPHGVPPKPPVPQSPPLLTEDVQRAIGELMQSPPLGVAALVGLVTLRIVGGAALSKDENKSGPDQ